MSKGTHHVPLISPCPQDLLSPSPLCPQCPTVSPRAPMFRVSHCVPRVLHVPRVPPCNPPPHVPRAPAPPIPGTRPHLGTPARGLPSDAPGTGSRRGPQSQAGTGTAPSPAAREACSAGRLTGRREGSGAMPGYQGLTVSQAGCKARVGWQPQGSQPPGPPRLQKWGAQRSQLLPTTLGRQAQVPLLRSQVQVPAAQWEARVPRGSQLQPAGR